MSENRYAGLTIDTHEALVEQIEYVIANWKKIGGFDCMIARSVLADERAKQAAYHFARKGYGVKVVGETDRSTDTHLAARIVVTPPLVIKVDEH